jgi:ribosomal protein S6
MAQDLAQNYELAYHITTNMEDAELQKTRSEVENVVSSNGGRISYAKDPEKLRLSYPIKKEQFAYFGYVQFALEDGQALSVMNEQLKLNNSVLRYLIVKVHPVSGKDADTLKRSTMGDKRRTGRGKTVAKPSEAQPVKEEELEKKLEDIIEKI